MLFKRLDNQDDSWGNPYYNPGAYGLEIVFCTDQGRGYDFDMFVVMRTIVPIKGIRKGTLFYATDAGCSCPSPYDGVEWIRTTKVDVIRAFDNWSLGVFDGPDAELKMKLRSI